LILGGSSFVGRNIIAALGSRRTVATYCSREIDGGVFFNARSMSLPDIVKPADEFSHALILLGDTKPDSCISDPVRSRALNIDALKSILQYLKDWNVLPVFFSTEAVFDGAAGNYRENDPPSPLMLYAQQKLEIESHIRESFGRYLIVRLSLVLGDHPSDGSLLSAWLCNIIQSKPLRCASDYICSPIYVGDVAIALSRLIDSGTSGLFHVGGPEAFSRFAIGRMLADVVAEQLGLSAELVPCSMADFDLKEDRPGDISLCSKKFQQATGIVPTGLRQVCEQLVANYKAVESRAASME